MCDKSEKNKILEKAIRNNKLEEVKALLSAGADANFVVHDFIGNCINETLLHCAHSALIVKELLLRGVNVNHKNIYRETPLHAAITLGKNLQLVRELLQNGAEVDATDRKGNTALNHAVRRGSQFEIIEELLKYGADINKRNNVQRFSENCYSPLNNAMKSENLAKLLIKYAVLGNDENSLEGISDVYKNYLNDCVCEVIKMKTDGIKIVLPLYDLVTNNSNMHLQSKNLLSFRLPNIDYSVDYPIYHDIIVLDKIKQYLKRAALLEKLKRVHIFTLNPDEKGTYITLISDLIPFITKYLSADDLMNLIIASETCSLGESDTELDEASTNRDAKRARFL